MSQTAKLIINDPESFNVLTTDAKKTIIKAATNTVNMQAAVARKNVVQAIKDNFIVRNNFTTKQVQYTQMPQGLYSLSAIQSTIGITEKAAYMERQEKGGSRKPVAGSTLAIPSDIARSGSKNKPVSRMYRINNLAAKRVRGPFLRKITSRKARQVARAYVAFKTGKLISFGRNLHRVTRFNASHGHISFKIKQVYSFSKSQTYTPATPFFKATCEKPAADGQKIFNAQMNKLQKT